MTHNDVVLESAALRAVIDPHNGAKIRSLQSLRTGKEFLYQDSRRAFDASRGYSYHDIGGIDECFPSVAACRGRLDDGAEYDYPDHGFLWSSAWDVVERSPRAVTLVCKIPALGCIVRRRCGFDGESTLRLDYEIVNESGAVIPFVYSAHPLLAADERTRVHFPGEASTAYVAGANSDLTIGEWTPLSGSARADIVGPFLRERRTVVKLFTGQLKSGWAAVSYPDSGERLVFAFDAAKLPHLGYLSCQGNDNLGDGHFMGEFLLAFEPTTGIGDDLLTNVRMNTLMRLAPGATFSFWIQLSIEELRRDADADHA